jgi:hypothetical protein
MSKYSKLAQLAMTSSLNVKLYEDNKILLAKNLELKRKNDICSFLIIVCFLVLFYNYIKTITC